MFDDYELYQGIALRQIVVAANKAVQVTPFERDGRVNAYVLDGNVGLFIKHSSKRMTPWPFTFHIEQVADLLDLEIAHPTSFVAFVCGMDGLVAIDVATLHQLVSFETSESAWIRISRKPRSMYSVSGNRDEMPNKVGRGATIIVDAIQEKR